MLVTLFTFVFNRSEHICSTVNPSDTVNCHQPKTRESNPDRRGWPNPHRRIGVQGANNRLLQKRIQ
jgi:hypothetical protein